jgi:oxygen-independent coproporphyrinogen-3 oxidase
MIQIILSDRIYENDVRPIVMSFYPLSEIRFLDINSAKDSQVSRSQIRLISIIFNRTSITIEITDDKGETYRTHNETKDQLLEKLAYKNAMKRQLYNMLSSLSKKDLPWGILTGIRPTKLVYDMLDKEIDEKEIYSWMNKEYMCSDEKIELSILIAKRERDLLKAMDYKKGYSLYIGIPFCPSTCLYCSFPSFSIEGYGQLVEGYLRALETEIKFASSCFPGKRLTTVYLGGGTPTTLSANQLDRLLGIIRANFDFTYVREFCVEAGRPDSISREKLEVLLNWGVDRISINPQTMQERTLDLIGRRHSVDQINEAFYLAREVGHNNINMDIIIGLPGETSLDVEDTLDKIKKLNPDSLTVHTLAIKRASRLNIEKDNYLDLRVKDASHMLRVSKEFTKNKGYLPYYLYRQKNIADNLENVGYARYGKEGLYNILIMEEKQTILALGSGAMSKFVFHNEKRIDRVDNVKNLKDYISRIDEMIKRKSDFLNKNPHL